MHDGIAPNLRALILEAAHSYMIYTSLVPRAKLLKWADIMLQMEAILAIDASTSFGSSPDMKARTQALHLLRRELKGIVYEPIAAMADSVRFSFSLIAKDKDTKEVVGEAEANLKAVVTECQLARLDPDCDVIASKNRLIAALNTAFRLLNREQKHQYPIIRTREEMIV